MKRILTLYFTYKGLSGFEIDQYVPFTTAVVDDDAEYEFTQQWLANILDARLKCDQDISSFVITETEETEEEAAKQTENLSVFVEHQKKIIPKPEGNIVTIDFGKKDGPDNTKDN